jgi:hypothetical protein
LGGAIIRHVAALYRNMGKFLCLCVWYDNSN